MDWDYLLSAFSKASKLFNRDEMADMLADDYEAIEKDGGPSRDSYVYANRVLARAKYSNIEMPINRTWYDDINKIVTIGNYNYALHHLMRDVGFTDVVRLEDRVAGELRVENVPKWKMIASHSARRTFCTINVLRGNNIHAIRRASGHSDLRCLEKYIRDE
jgi:hypothetical protein